MAKIVITPELQEAAKALLADPLRKKIHPALQAIAAGKGLLDVEQWRAWHGIDAAAYARLCPRLDKLASMADPASNGNGNERDTAATVFAKLCAPGIVDLEMQEALRRRDTGSSDGMWEHLRRNAERTAKARATRTANKAKADAKAWAMMKDWAEQRAASKAAKEEAAKEQAEAAAKAAEAAAAKAHAEAEAAAEEKAEQARRAEEEARMKAESKPKDTRKGDRHKPRMGDRHSPGYMRGYMARRRAAAKGKPEP
jgi:hypothetical protein